MRRATYPETLSELQEALDGASRRGGELIVVAGGLASGKTAVITRFLQAAADTGAVTLTATGYREDSSVPLVLMEQLIRSGALPPEVESRIRTSLHAVRPSLDLEETGLCRTSDAALADFGHELCDALRTASRVRPVVVGVDDVHFADPCSQRLLLYLWRRLCSAPVVFVLGEWVWPHPATTTFDAHLRRLKHRRVRLSPLSTDELRELAVRSRGEALGEIAARRLAGRLEELTGGNPLLATALLSEQRTGDPSPAPDGPFAQAILTGLVRWGDELLEVAQAVAVLGDQAEVKTIARVLDRDPARVGDVLGVLQDAGFLTGCVFRAEAARRAVLTSLTSIQRAALNERAASVLLLAGSPATAVSGHLVEAGTVSGDDGVAALRITAEQLVARGHPEDALRCLELAREATEDDEIRSAIEAAALRSAWRVRPSAADWRHAYLQPLLHDGRLSFADAIGVLRHTTWQARPG
ncbi:MAG: hypothetical protein QG622_3703, partial [Actinomycetota bacterium]|nr:hypothetical protein [Actinomycetota bacterium]